MVNVSIQTLAVFIKIGYFIKNIFLQRQQNIKNNQPNK